jgi:hypothetical protein
MNKKNFFILIFIVLIASIDAWTLMDAINSQCGGSTNTSCVANAPTVVTSPASNVAWAGTGYFSSANFYKWTMNTYIYQCKIAFYLNITDNNGIVICTKFPFGGSSTDYCCATGDQACMSSCTMTTSNGTTSINCCS